MHVCVGVLLGSNNIWALSPSVLQCRCVLKYKTRNKMFWKIYSLALVMIFATNQWCECLLQPKESEHREIKDLSGMWKFRADYSPSRDKGFQEKWYQSPLSQTGEIIPMPVPSSYNDITADGALRDFVGWVWYETDFYVSKDWFDGRNIFLRFGSAHYNTIVWVNTVEVMRHSGGHLPFEAEVSKYFLHGATNRLTVAVNNTLTPTTLPPGTITYKNDTSRYPEGYFTQNIQMDFFNYAGIHRPVLLYTTPSQYISDVTIVTRFNETAAYIHYNVEAQSTSAVVVTRVLNADGKAVGFEKGLSGVIVLTNYSLWWPYTMSNTTYAYLYTLELTLISSSEGSVIDIYRQPFGIRTVNVTNKQLLINNKPFYCLGLGRHEDSDIRGKGVDLPLIARDYSLMRWLGANCFRTSHYPYAEEIMDEADRFGFVVIDECPGVGIKSNNLGNVSLEHHKSVMRELVARDKNRPSVVMWSVANEPVSADTNAGPYFKEVISTTRQADSTRLVTFVIGPSDYWKDQVVPYVDIICVNHYYAWYSDMGHIEVIGLQIKQDLDMWHKTFNKSVILSEYGADTISGFHSLPTTSFTEDFQVDYLKAHHTVFDVLRNDYLVGEMVWNFADFMTVQGVNRPYGNHKGIFTRQRQPKPAAFTIRNRYVSLGTQH
ncbi:GUSB [Bugula neritina]|uniref:Beta-glucuronidase n=1 Tax=Bugula neritina TaxID=10212 RepID=A0A7J7KT96_BUGNE|nr:GUSB [Bugula neritina]